MKKFLKFIGGFVAIVVVLLVIAGFVVAKTFNPNDYRHQIEQYVYKNTGRQLTIQSGMQWSFYPWLGLEIPSVSIENPTGFTGPNLATLQNIKFKVKLLPLFSGNIEVSQISVANANINLIVNQHNQVNWRANNNPKPTTPSTQNQSNQSTTTTKPPVRSLSIEKLELTNSNIHIINQRTNSALNITKIHLMIEDFSPNKEFPINISYNLSQHGSQTTVESKINAQVKINALAQEIDLPNFAMHSVVLRPNLPKIPLGISGKVTLKIKTETLNITDLSVMLANMPIVGAITMSELLHTPNVRMNLESSKTDVNQLLTTLANNGSLKGTLTFKTNLQAQGASASAMLNNLAGQGNINIVNGSIKGINIAALLTQAVALINKQVKPINTQTKNETAFSKVTASYNIQHGILTNNDLVLHGEQITADGHGTINLTKGTINYSLDTKYAASSQQDAPNFSLPILVSGNLNNPRVTPDFSAIAKKVLKDEAKDFINEKSKDIGNVLKNLFH